ncbi:hypothetical protein EVAR_39062_1 [Eumeta japonica]|uniref:Uncharacterized protein n=1 Tax=Eumeta variegata TaxID=151549 RepID=A0A4C1WQD6_EUMVA|nr:hypothetical protein EVAR_39062_1 [Eumeta japonica]
MLGFQIAFARPWRHDGRDLLSARPSAVTVDIGHADNAIDAPFDISTINAQFITFASALSPAKWPRAVTFVRVRPCTQSRLGSPQRASAPGLPSRMKHRNNE